MQARLGLRAETLEPSTRGWVEASIFSLGQENAERQGVVQPDLRKLGSEVHGLDDLAGVKGSAEVRVGMACEAHDRMFACMSRGGRPLPRSGPPSSPRPPTSRRGTVTATRRDSPLYRPWPGVALGLGAFHPSGHDRCEGMGKEPSVQRPLPRKSVRAPLGSRPSGVEARPPTTPYSTRAALHLRARHCDCSQIGSGPALTRWPHRFLVLLSCTFTGASPPMLTRLTPSTLALGAP